MRETTIDPKFTIDRQGKTFVLYAGLLDAAFQTGLHTLDTELVQIPTEENKQTAIVKAVARFHPMVEEQNGPEGYTFSGIGDASPENVSRNIAPHLIRMAETRAKARALRDAINVGMTSFEEVDTDDAPREQRPRAASSQASENSSSTELPERTEGGATRKQLNYMLSLLPEHRKKQLEEEHGSVETWSKDAVRALIDKMTSGAANG